jgi:glycosidase
MVRKFLEISQRAQYSNDKVKKYGIMIFPILSFKSMLCGIPMLQKIRSILLLIYICLGIFFQVINCNINPSSEIDDLIQPISLVSGLSDTIPVGDIFYAEKYKLKFKDHKNIYIQYVENTETLILRPDTSLEGFSLIHFVYAGKDYSIPVKVGRKQIHRFRYKLPQDSDKIYLFGSFNNWNRENLPLHDEDGDGMFEISLALDPGRYEYKFFVEGNELLDPLNSEKISNPFGAFNSVLTIYPRHRNRAILHLLRSQEKNGKIKIDFYFEGGEAERILRSEEIIALLGNSQLATEKIEIDGQKIRIKFDESDLLDKLPLRIAVNQNGLSTHFQEIPLKSLHPVAAQTPDFYWQDAILYAIMVDRFLDGDPDNTKPVDHPELDEKANFYGGDLQGIINKLEEGYFTDLGVNVLWLSPIIQNTLGAFREFPAPHRYFTGYHGYWPIHHKLVDYRFGDLELFKKLVDKAHQRGMKVILDFVANHVHQEHPFYQNNPEWFGQLVLPDGRQNIRMWDEYRLTTWFDTFLPSFDFLGSKQALEVMTDNAVWWMKETAIDGFRQDAVKHIPNDFWRMLTRKLKREITVKENRSFYQIGETFGGYDLISSYVNNGQLNAQFNFNLYDIALKVFLEKNSTFQILESEMQKTFDVYGVNHLMGNLMDSHDKVRYMAYADGDVSTTSGDAKEIGWKDPPQVNNPLSYQKARLYLAYILTIPGVPVIYYGDEIGMTGAADPDNRRPMRFNDDLSKDEQVMLKSVKKLIQLRRNHTALRHGDFLTIQADKDIFAFIRSDANERLLVILNKSEIEQNVLLKIPESYRIKKALDISSDKSFEVSNSELHLSLGKYTWRIFKLFDL